MTEENTPQNINRSQVKNDFGMANKDLDPVKNVQYGQQKEDGPNENNENLKTLHSGKDEVHDDSKIEGSPYNFKDPNTNMYVVKYDKEKDLQT